MIDPRFAILAALITVGGCAMYAWDTLRGNTQPNRVSWSLWALAPMIAFAAELAQHAGLNVLMTFAVGFGPVLVVIASFHDSQAYARLTPIDVICGVLSLAALVGWALTRVGNVAIVLSILADALGAIPTVRKAYADRGSESAVAFLADCIGAAITLATIPTARWSFAAAAFPGYILVLMGALSVLILVPRRPSAVGASPPEHPG